MDIRDYLEYNPATGQFIWKLKPAKNIEAGEIAGTENNGYIQIEFRYVLYRAHRLAWFFHYGDWPEGQIDHINRIRNDNRIENLRVVNNRINNQNRPDFNYGVQKNHNKWVTRMRINGVKKHIGSFDSYEEAKQAYINMMEALNE